MLAAHEPELKSNSTLSENGRGEGLALEHSDTQISQHRLEAICRDVLLAIGEDPDRDGLRDTPRRWANFWREFMEYEPGTLNTTFKSVSTDQMVVVSGMRIWSLCEHHLMPFWCDVSIGYIAQERVLGLSKFARIAHKYAHRLQLQERLVTQIADEVAKFTESKDVAVLAVGEHLCMSMRGISTPALMKSSVMRGVFLHGPSARQEFLSLVNS